MRVRRAGAWGLAAALSLVPGALLPGAGAAQTGAGTPRGLDVFVPGQPDTDARARAARIRLGERLFFDPILSGDGTRSCADCHRPARMFADSGARSVGVAGLPTARNAPSLLNVAYAERLFWDGRVRSLEEAVIEPVTNPVELASDPHRLVERLREDRTYVRAFREAFGEAPAMRGLAEALANYLRTLRSGGSIVDRHRDGGSRALPRLAAEGRELFGGRAGCWACHTGPLFSDGRLHNTGVSWGSPDTGAHLRTGHRADLGRFRTPSLRNVARTAPYMHDGSLATLEEVVTFYDRGGGTNPYLDPELRPLGLTPRERAALVAFLEALTGG